MRVIQEKQTSEDVAALNAIWDSDESFLFMPERSDVLSSWIESAIARLPTPFLTGHFMLLTSGSTGKPKLVIGVKKRAERLAAVLHELQANDAAQAAVVALPLSYCYAFVNQWLWSRVAHRSLHLTPGFRQADQLKKALEETQDSMLCLVGAQVPLLESFFAGSSFPRVIRLHFAGGPFPQAKIDVVKAFFPNAKIFNNYGCAEAMPRLTLRPLEDSDDGANIGSPLPGITLKTGPDGEMLFNSPFGAVAFYEDQYLHLIGPDDFIPSGDMGEANPDGSWQIAGRSNQVFKRYGEKIAIPRLLKTVTTCWKHEAAFYREKDPSGEEGHVLVLAPRPTEEQVRAILQEFRKHHSRPHWPLRLESTVVMPMLPNGKSDLAGLRGLTDLVVHWRQRI